MSLLLCGYETALLVEEDLDAWISIGPPFLTTDRAVCINMQDSWFADLGACLDTAIPHLVQWRNQDPQAILGIHCTEGKSRCAAVACAFYMVMEPGLSLQQAEARIAESGLVGMFIPESYRNQIETWVPQYLGRTLQKY